MTEGSGRTITLRTGHQLWLREVPGGPGLPLLLLHGGPGAAHDYMEPLQALSRDRPVIFYDQLGCGRSDRPADTSLYTLAQAARDLADLRAVLGLTRCHILGQSAGGMLALEHLAVGGTGVESLTLASTPVSIPAFRADMDGLVDRLDPLDRDTIRRHLAEGRFNTPEFEAAAMAFYRKHLLRRADWPDCALRSVAFQAESPAYAAMIGAVDFHVTGNVRDWDRAGDLAGLRMPVLVTHGGWDYILPRGLALLRDGLPGARFVGFPDSSHLSHIEEPAAFLAAVAGFLQYVERDL